MPVDPAESPCSLTIMSLPPETMLNIFDYLHVGHKVTTDRTTKHYTSFALFPFSIALVCSHWRDIIAQKSEYWSSVVIMLDFSFDSSVMMTCLEAFTQLETIKLHLVSYDEVEVEPSAENALFGAFVRILAPFFHKCKTISVDVQYRSTIVAAARILDGLIAPDLDDLYLVSRVTDSTEDIPFTSLNCPKLKYVSMDAKSFVGFANANAQLETRIERNHDFGRVLSVFPYHPETESPKLTRSALISAITHFIDSYGPLEYLLIEDVRFDQLDFDVPEAITAGGNYVHLFDLDARFLSAFFANFDPPEAEGDEGILSLTRCELDFPIAVPFMATLMLRDIDDTHTVLHALKFWDGLIVDVSNCAGFTDGVLDAMARERLCGEVVSLTVRDCPVSVAGVRGFVASRRQDETFQCLDVSGAPPLSSEDKEWFRERVFDEVLWNKEEIR
ncbi:hypothetical protein CONPUDRAFT_135353 [Coniophora puteana RWD-64-598 SS2]|uniref:F-box domain-containing protein n=1 Tax=Coniophora puteana (strain RWD-64-598) TaxID=741705 RepID=A0A5M3N306_CONPW|nr:uncharacterized protein CONPUDRAFT_135353 [Coniophora puteana RWD-64-598 SS2]EIW85753.1 hypothetical protein CONPUDRAFT_135353 [Coniophora puteana RWD-64-598 SS2]